MKPQYGFTALLYIINTVIYPIHAGPAIRDWKNIEVVPAAQSNSTTHATFTSSSFGLDAQHVHPINASAWEWFYFDAVSHDGLSSIVIVVYTAPATGFFGGGPPSDIVVSSLFASTPDNPTFFFEATPGSEAVVTSIGNGASGIWKDTGFKFSGDCDLKDYIVQINSPQIGVEGFANIKSIAPPHYPCGPAVAGEKLDVMPHIGWANAIPDAHAEIDLVVNGTRIQFTGVGYHDKNWGDAPFTDVVGSWTWGHGRLGPYSIVWWDSLTASGEEFVSGYVSRDNKIISVGCSGVKVRPSSPGAVYPPFLGTPKATSYHGEIDLGKLGSFSFDVDMTAHIVDTASYDRWTGMLSGGIKGQKVYKGISVYEQFTLEPPKSPR